MSARDVVEVGARGAAGVGRALVRTVAGVRWYTATLLGDRDYARYVEHLARVHPGADPVSEREYWRVRHAEQDAHPGARCC
ncbi:hypothetical protein Cch01nite_00720 [Cellulomonas chitinilytica]|uniref:YbdD/YjiX family protein n=1 Tax=Cellulomonas chitinilytica TaxID=398759 RepID=A0A919P021_9CELL|nr:YbdD/YjiX family protein [Cellulomonas chitinilytica]GIG19348.1 hypothetical protein Cch01nite_00720 [Cellulomonas chitinilytica]